MVLKVTTTTRYALLVFLAIIGLHSILRISHEDYGRATSLENIAAQLSWGSTDLDSVPDEYYMPVETTPPDTLLSRRANATLLMLARNSDVNDAVKSVRRLEDRFNRKFGYPWLFLNEEPFSDEFKTRIRNVIHGEVTFAEIPHDHWYQPDWIDEDRARAGREKMVADNIIYGGSVSYRNMCRFNSGFFFRHPLLQNYKWYWRVEPDVHFHCDISFDPFLYMEDHNKTYAFTITMYEFGATIPTLWDATKEFVDAHPQYVARDNAMGYMSDDGGNSYNNCHFWSNFEIASMDFWRSEAYTKYFEHLDAKGGFYYERWGDAPVHSIAVALFQDKSQIQFFDEIGYEHNPYTHCPRNPDAWARGKCDCEPKRSFDYDGYSCMRQWDRIWQ
ncbi:glycosyltransferase family 15 protein [Dichomitus squalens]|uniref:Glycosyltransferase family 15 protein n=2 Tax=Dichomitus squalens TaxID=114155 RepID=A0A4Q9NQA8_9APHY|nr:glycosyltransferase family 15 protein [Dichomitus squalens LYAD-421 SS1]EJF61893.1 glycosyltransferase family 15 protein [Dichomitus squalens LYAD-421 SS1]TBU43729.1 glycosyltransferase family 15 protein [Dichomitus squalens]TBU53811.1 glycosyltransferase family 15 protein [Dichomitus squalens]